MDTMNPPRNALIRERLDRHFLQEIGVSVATPEPVWWWDRYEAYGSLAILGWAWPQANPEAEWDETKHEIIVPYCPEIIDEQTTELDDQHLAAYLTLIEYVIDLHIGYWGDVEDDEARHRLVDDEVKRELPQLHRMLHDALALATLRRAISD